MQTKDKTRSFSGRYITRLGLGMGMIMFIYMTQYAESNGVGNRHLGLKPIIPEVQRKSNSNGKVILNSKMVKVGGVDDGTGRVDAGNGTTRNLRMHIRRQQRMEEPKG